LVHDFFHINSGALPVNKVSARDLPYFTQFFVGFEWIDLLVLGNSRDTPPKFHEWIPEMMGLGKYISG